MMSVRRRHPWISESRPVGLLSSTRRRMLRTLGGFSLLMCGAAPALATPIVTYTLSLNDDGSGCFNCAPNVFAVYADVSTDNGGLFGWSVDLSGPIDQLYTTGPAASYTKSGSPTKYAGFTTGVTEDVSAGKIGGVQDLGAGANLIPIYGFGQVGGDLSATPPKPIGYAYHDINKNLSGPAYRSHLLLGVGSWASPGAPSFEPGSADNKASVYVDGSGTASTTAEVHLRTTDGCFFVAGVASSGKLTATCERSDLFRVSGVAEYSNQALGGSIRVTGANGGYSSEVDQLLDPSATSGSAPVQSIGDEAGNLFVMAEVSGDASAVAGIINEFNNGSLSAEAPHLHQLYDSQFGAGGFNLLYTSPNFAGTKVVNWDFVIAPGAVIDQLAVVPEPGVMGIAGIGVMMLCRRGR